MKKLFILLILLWASQLAARQSTSYIQGTVSNASGYPIAGAYVSIQARSVITDAAGHFSIAFSNRDDTLVVSHASYQVLRYPVVATTAFVTLILIEWKIHSNSPPATSVS